MAKKKHYKTKYWKGKTMYVCEFCFFDTFDEEKMKAHIKEHFPQKKSEPVSVPMYDRFGNLIKYKDAK